MPSPSEPSFPGFETGLIITMAQFNQTHLAPGSSMCQGLCKAPRVPWGFMRVTPSVLGVCNSM